jgi:HK97 family phage portal protein
VNIIQRAIKYVANQAGLLVSGVSEPERWLVDILGGTKSKSGVEINEKTAVKVIAVFACLRLISEQMASLPLPVYRYVKQGKIKAYDHPNYNLLNSQPNPYTTAFDFWQMIIVNLMLLGRGIAEIERDPKTLQPVALWPIPANRVKVYINKQTHEPYYDIYQLDGTVDRLYSDRVLDIKGMGLEELNAYDPVVIARECLGLSLAAEEFAGEYIKKFKSNMNRDYNKQYKEYI